MIIYLLSACDVRIIVCDLLHALQVPETAQNLRACIYSIYNIQYINILYIYIIYILYIYYIIIYNIYIYKKKFSRDHDGVFFFGGRYLDN